LVAGEVDVIGGGVAGSGSGVTGGGGDAFDSEEIALDLGAAESEVGGEAAGGVDDAVAGDVALVGVAVESATDGASGARVAGEERDLAVGGDAAARDVADDVINAGVELRHRLSVPWREGG
jgi:hypothetical protein